MNSFGTILICLTFIITGVFVIISSGVYAAPALTFFWAIMIITLGIAYELIVKRGC